MQCNSINMIFQTLSSGSKGNSAIVICGEVKLLIDAGISYNRIKNILDEEGLDFPNFSGILITHSHSDHIKGLESIIKHTKLKVIIPKEMYEELKEIVPLNRTIFIQDKNKLKDVEIDLIHTSHDTKSSVGYIITYNNRSLVYITDTGYINRKYLKVLKGKSIYLIESNHDEEMLMNGPYPPFLKQRVLSDKGHLSNKTTAGYLEQLITEDTKYILLAHLSEKNNTEEKALEETKAKVINKNIEIMIARQDEASKLIEV